MRCSCCCMCSFLILGDITEQITASFSISWVYFNQILTVLETLLSQLHVSFVTRRQAEYDEMAKAFDLELRVFCLVLVLPCCVILDMESPPVHLFLLLTLVCLSRYHIVLGRNSFPGIQTQQVSVPSKLCRYCSNRKCGLVGE